MAKEEEGWGGGISFESIHNERIVKAQCNLLTDFYEVWEQPIKQTESSLYYFAHKTSLTATIGNWKLI